MPSLKDKQAEEMKLWRRWQSGDTDAIGPLMRSYEPVVQQQVNKLKNAPLPPIFIETEVKKQLLGAFETYDPNRGTQLNTWVHSRLPKVLRNTIYSYSNLGYIPEERQRQISTFMTSKDRLEEQFKRPPTAMEISSDLSWDLRQVERMEKELRPKKLLTEEGDFSFISDDTEQKALRYVYMSLPPDQQVVFEHHFGWAGKPRIGDKELAGRLKKDVKGIKKLKRQVADQIEEALRVVE